MDSLTELFCLIDDFCQAFEPEWNQRLVADGSKKRQRPASLCLSELLPPRCIFPLSALFEAVKGECTGISILDSSPLAVCDNLRIGRHRVFAGIAALAYLLHCAGLPVNSLKPSSG